MVQVIFNFNYLLLGAYDQVERALSILKKRFPPSRFPHVDFSDMRPLAAAGPVLQPEMMQVRKIKHIRHMYNVY